MSFDTTGKMSFDATGKMMQPVSKQLLEDVETKDDFAKYMSQIGWVGNGFVDFSKSVKEDGGFNFAAFDREKVKTVSEKVGLVDEVIVFLAKKVFSHIFLPDTGCDNIDPVHMKSEMVRISFYLIFFTFLNFLVQARGANFCGIYQNRSGAEQLSVLFVHHAR
jgi:hypothetical protein